MNIYTKLLLTKISFHLKVVSLRNHGNWGAGDSSFCDILGHSGDWMAPVLSIHGLSTCHGGQDDWPEMARLSQCLHLRSSGSAVSPGLAAPPQSRISVSPFALTREAGVMG